MDISVLNHLHLVACGHGTRDPRGQSAVAALIEEIGRHVDSPVHGCSVDVQQPEVGDVVAALDPGSSGVIVPLLLSTGFHTRVDLKRAAHRFPVEDEEDPEHEVMVADPLGPSVRLARLQARRLREAGWEPGEHVVMGVAGSSVLSGRSDAETQRDYLSQVLEVPVSLGYGAAVLPEIGEAVAAARAEGAASVAISSYLLAPGTFYDRLLDAGADRVSPPLLVEGDAEGMAVVADLAVSRAAECAHRFFEGTHR
ncbi:sirohydrochlorin chelatase [Rothia sp. AR01]|uniref:Sirohydrochlorin chelatase n=1 Tax=Rothia santali TaxID=2949643 RepID=A0A9X2KI27_9MICC|nr:CbiX/SirB N-terminal domain-containing protein [Rothia santali]MCP3425783.1 sirohydrochlorin chelatase [Rothia santali]